MRTVSKAMAGVGVGAGVSAIRQWLSRHDGGSIGRLEPTDRWLVVTVNRPPDEIQEIPEPLVELGDSIETRMQTAPGGKGTELAARLREPAPSGLVARVSGTDPRQDVRRALREAKSLLETGEVLRADTPPSPHPGPAGRVLRTLTRRASGEGRL